MSKPKYLYIDDENGKSEVSTLNGFNDTNLIEVERFPLGTYKDFGSLKLELVAKRKSKLFDGLIIDLRLDGNGEDNTDFNAASLSQELRSVCARGEIEAFPIVLCSTEQNIRQTYDTDKTSHDLFDYKVSKSDARPNWKKTSIKLLSLANGYDFLNQEKHLPTKILGLTDLKELDQRIKEKLETLSVNYDFAHFIVKNFFHQTNPLINEKILAARLGIDLKETSSDNWEAIKSVFGSSKYSGLFSDGWNRWWADSVIEQFASFSSGERLAFINAERRVEILKDFTGIKDLVFAKPLEFCNSSEFWTICEGYKVPIDPLEAFKVFTTVDLKSWQESKYISLLAILERIGVTDRGIKPHSSEKDRIEYTKELLNIN